MTGGRLNQFNITKQSRDYDEASNPPTERSRLAYRAFGLEPAMLSCVPQSVPRTSVVCVTCSDMSIVPSELRRAEVCVSSYGVLLQHA